MDHLYFVSYAQQQEGNGFEEGKWNFHEIILETHPIVWMAKKRAEELAAAREDRRLGFVIPERIFRLLSWQKLEGEAALHARNFISNGQLFPAEDGVGL
jgi:hypothetical protein